MAERQDWTRIGDVEVARVVEWLGPIGTVDQMFPDSPPEAWSDELAPHFWVPEQRAYRAAIQSWVLRSRGRTIVVDTGVGNGRRRPQVPAFENLDTDYLARLEQVGVAPDDVDVVVNTHIHYDHVGWNTRDRDGTWVPTFPRATYLVPEPDVDYFRPENAARMRPPTTEDEERRFAGIRLVFEDSIAPVLDSGQLEAWSGGRRVDEVVRLEPAPGHTPGSSVVWLESGPGAVFVGDLVHTPVQIARPGDSCAFDLDAAQARVSRRAVLTAAAHAGATVFPAHFAGHGGASVREDADGPGEFCVDRWADLPAI